jgi:hypothetical protein
VVLCHSEGVDITTPMAAAGLDAETVMVDVLSVMPRVAGNDTVNSIVYTGSGAVTSIKKNRALRGRTLAVSFRVRGWLVLGSTDKKRGGRWA